MYTRALAVFVCALALVLPVHAATYLVPSDAEMIQRADDIVVAAVESSVVERNHRGGIVTRYTLRIEEAFKGDHLAGQTITLTELGGVLGDAAKKLSGVPQYVTGERYLVFTNTNTDLEPVTYGLSLGQFHLAAHSRRVLAIRDAIHGFDRNFEVHGEQSRDAARFIDYIRDTVAQHGRAATDYFVAEAEVETQHVKIGTSSFSRNSYLMQDNGRGYRWSSPAAGWVRSGTQPGSDGPGAVSVAFSQWNGATSSINYTDDGVDNTATAGLSSRDFKNGILFDDPNGELRDFPGVVGLGGTSFASAATLDGEPSFAIEEADVVIAKGSFAQACLNSVMTHEIGHTLGFRHSDQKPSPIFPGVPCGGDPVLDCSGDAIMNSNVTCTLAADLRGWDTRAAGTVYGGGPVCTPPSITTQPQSKSIALGASATLGVVAAGSAPFTYAWFEGAVGDTSKPVGTNAATINVTPPVTTTYWVRVTNTCSTQQAVSSAATVTVTCLAPSITTFPNSVNITEGNQVTLQVAAAGSGLSYQWYLGPSGDARSPVGQNSPNLSVSPVITTQYWVRVSGSCGDPVDSPTVTVNVTPCADVEIQAPVATPNPGTGNFRLNVNAFSSAAPLQFQWFRGNTPGSGGTLIGSTQAINVTVTAVTSYWARVTNGCGRSEFSSLITVAPCTLPTIDTQPEDVTIPTGTNASLSIGVGSGITVKWYRGAVGDRTAQVGNTAAVSVGPLTEDTRFWAEVANTCGAIASRQVTITVEQATTNLFMLGGRFNVQVRYRNQFANPVVEGLLTGKSLQSSTLSDTAIFWFDSPLVVELMVRVSDARPFDNAFHVYLGGLSDVEFFITVTDKVTGKSVEYHKKANELVGQTDRKSFPAEASAPVSDAEMMKAAADTSTLRMLGRYDVRVRYRNQFANPVGEGYLLGRSIARGETTDTAVFYFENPESVEWMVRFSDVRPFAERVDFFHGGLSDVEFVVEVTDTKTGLQKEYPVKPFSLAGGVDRQSFKP